jgi:hypothetical protein
MKNEIAFGCLGFATNTAFIIKNGKQFGIGSVCERLCGEYEFWQQDFWIEHGELTKEEVPTAEAIIAEYKKQYAEKGVMINKEIVYAG